MSNSRMRPYFRWPSWLLKFTLQLPGGAQSYPEVSWELHLRSTEYEVAKTVKPSGPWSVDIPDGLV